MLKPCWPPARLIRRRLCSAPGLGRGQFYRLPALMWYWIGPGLGRICRIIWRYIFRLPVYSRSPCSNISIWCQRHGLARAGCCSNPALARPTSLKLWALSVRQQAYPTRIFNFIFCQWQFDMMARHRPRATVSSCMLGRCGQNRGVMSGFSMPAFPGHHKSNLTI